MNKNTVRWIGRALMAVAIVFIIWKFSQQDLDFSLINFAHITPGLIGLLLLYIATVFILAYGYFLILSGLANKAPARLNTIRLYSMTGLYRYIPGNVMHLIGRNVIPATEPVSYAEVNIASSLEIFALFIVALVLAVVSVFKYFINYIQSISLSSTQILLVVIIAIAIVIVLIIFRKKIRSLKDAFIEKVSRLSAVRISQYFVLVFLTLIINAITYLLLLYLLNAITPGSSAITILGLYILSWLIGFVTPGAPGGIGIRETMMVLLLDDAVSMDYLLLSAVLLRIISIVGDVAAFGLVQSFYTLRNKKSGLATK